MNNRWYLILAVVIGALGVVLAFNLFYSGEPGELIGDDDRVEDRMVQMPEEYMIYQKYLSTIARKDYVHDKAVIEATVISVDKDTVCPDRAEGGTETSGCSIEPYPDHSGQIRIDSINSYTNYSEQAEDQPVEREGERVTEYEGGEVDAPSQSSPGYKGIAPPDRKEREPQYNSLKEGQEVRTKFLLTTDPAVWQKLPVGSTSPGGGDGGTEAEEGEKESYEQQTASKDLTGADVGRDYRPIPKDNDGRWVFTIRLVAEGEEKVKDVLPGLEAGDRFKTEIEFDGTVYVEKYQKLS